MEEDRCLQNEWDNLPGWRVAAVAEVQAQSSSRGRCSCRTGDMGCCLAGAESDGVSIRGDELDMMVVGEKKGAGDGVSSAKRSSPGLHSD